MRFYASFSSEPRDRLAVVDVVWAIEAVVPGRMRRDAERVIDRRRHVLRLLRRVGWIGAVFVGRPDHGAAANAAAGEEDRLHGPPMIATGTRKRIGKSRDFRSTPEFSRHDDQSVVQK